jgi:hypothetical protein
MTTPTTAAPDRLGRARLALEGLSTADAFGEQLMHAGPCAATHLADYAGGLWACGAVGGDVDTTCAMSAGSWSARSVSTRSRLSGARRASRCRD